MISAYPIRSRVVTVIYLLWIGVDLAEAQGTQRKNQVFYSTKHKYKNLCVLCASARVISFNVYFSQGVPCAPLYVYGWFFRCTRRTLRCHFTGSSSYFLKLPDIFLLSITVASENCFQTAAFYNSGLDDNDIIRPLSG